MKNRSKIAIAAVLVLGVLAAIAGVAATGGQESFDAVYTEENRPVWVDENGIWDNSLLPSTFDVLDHTGAVVGQVETTHYGTELYPLPVIDSDGNLVGHVGENGFWRVGEEEPFIEGAFTVIEEFDADGERTRHEIIQAIVPGPGEEGPTGSTH